MKIEELDVRGFGRLRDFNLVLAPRVTVILGENETGKSTVHRVIRAALYGIDAGGQGRPVERSDWARWAPWAAGSYGFAMTLVEDSGRRLRIAARLDNREQRVQVIEIGGGDITDDLRVGRMVAPGQHILGFDEAVFCATSWLGDDGLRIGAPESASQRARSLQEAVERLADSGHSTTAAEATTRLRDALDRVGSERRAQSPLGVATNKLRHLSSEIESARRRLDAYAGEQERLLELEEIAASARAEQLDSERAWLIGRLAALGDERIELQRTEGQRAELTAVIAATAASSGIAIEDEPRIQALAGQWRQLRSNATESELRFATAAPLLERTRQRRAEIAAGLVALGDLATVDDAQLLAARRLEADLDSVEAELRRLGDGAVHATRTDALRREIAATGLGGIRIGNTDSVAALVATVRERHDPRSNRVAAATVQCVGALGAGGLWALQQPRWAAASAVLGLTVALAWLALGRLRGDGSAQACRQLARLCPDLDLSDAALARTAARLPMLAALHDELLRHEVRAASHRDQIDAAQQGVGAICAAIAELAVEAGIAPTATGAIDSRVARELISAIRTAAATARRRDELDHEDQQLAITEAAQAALGDDAARAREALNEVAMRLYASLAGPGCGAAPKGANIDSHDLEIEVQRFIAGCDIRRRHDLAAAQLAALRGRGLPADESHFSDTAARLSRDLISRGGNPADAALAAPLDRTALARLERAVEHARQRADNAQLATATLRARLAAALDGLPNLADLDDEYAHCAAARDRALQQRAALTRAVELLALSTRSVHRDLAPRLAESMSSRLALLTDARYTEVFVDTDHFGIALAGRERPDLVPIDQVSHGTRDQVALLLRLALAEVLSESGESVPLFLDEPLLSADPHRRNTTLDFLCELSRQHQVVITSSDPELAKSIEARLGGAATVATMVSLSPAMDVDGVAVVDPMRRVRI